MADSQEPSTDVRCIRRVRNFVTFMMFLGMANAYVMRTNMSVAIVAMVNRTALTNIRAKFEGEFVWTYETQGYILSSFFYGYVLTQIPFGFLIKHYGAKHFLGWGMMINSIAAFFVPLAAREGGVVPLCIVRFIQGLGEGPIVPCTHSILAQWTPPVERSRHGAIVYAGAQFGTIVAMPLSGLLAEYGFDGGWPSIFYVFGVISTIWCVVFLIFVFDSPSKCKRMQQGEREYIEKSIWAEEKVGGSNTKTPFCEIAKSLPFWAILIAHCGHNYGYETLMTELPTYMNTVLELRIKDNGFLSALPYLSMWLMAMVFAFIADYLISRGMSITHTRKIMNSFGQYGPGLAMICVGFCDFSVILTIIIFSIGMGMNGAIYSGFKINHLDLSPQFAGLLIAITNCWANLVGLTGPIVAGHVIHYDQSVAQWRYVFFIAAGVYFFVATFYNIFGTGKQRW